MSILWVLQSTLLYTCLITGNASSRENQDIIKIRGFKSRTAPALQGDAQLVGGGQISSLVGHYSAGASVITEFFRIQLPQHGMVRLLRLNMFKNSCGKEDKDVLAPQAHSSILYYDILCTVKVLLISRYPFALLTELFESYTDTHSELPMPDRVAILKLPGERVVAAAHHNVVSSNTDIFVCVVVAKRNGFDEMTKFDWTRIGQKEGLVGFRPVVSG